MEKVQDPPENSKELMEPKSLANLRLRIEKHDISTYKWRNYLTPEENRGLFLGSRLDQYLGRYSEQRIAEYNPTPGAKHLPEGNVVDWIDDENIAEQKQSPRTDNSASRKENLRKLKDQARKLGLRPLYCYVEDRRKKRYTKQGVLHLHGVAIFEFFQIPDKWEIFQGDIDAARDLIVVELSEKFNHHFREKVTRGMVSPKTLA